MAFQRISASYASSLLDAEIAADHTASQNGGTLWKTGIHALDDAFPKQIWNGQAIVGIGSIDETKGVKISSSSPSLALEIVTRHLLDQPEQTTAPPSVFIVCTTTQTTSTIHRLHSNLSRASHAHTPPQRKTDPKALLGNLSLLQYLDISGLLESLAEVSTLIDTSKPQRRVLLIQGLTTTLTATQRRHGTVQAAAMMTSVEQALKSLKRSAGGLCLCVIELDVVRKVSEVSDGSSDYGAGAEGKQKDGSALQTGFAAKGAREMRLNLHSTPRNLTERVLDTIVVVHDAGGKLQGKSRAVEVVKDDMLRGDDGSPEGKDIHFFVGQWAEWK